jgi:hypothetical protein
MRRAFIGLLRDFFTTWPFASRAQRCRVPVVGASNRTSSVLNSLSAVGVAAIALVAPQVAFPQNQIEIVNFQSLTFPGSLFTPPFMPAPQDGTPATIFGILRLPETTGQVPAVVITHGCSGLTGAETYWGEVSSNSASPRSWSTVSPGGASRAPARVLTRSARPVCSRMSIEHGTSWQPIRASTLRESR